jgi:hypothetical protein
MNSRMLTRSLFRNLRPGICEFAIWNPYSGRDTDVLDDVCVAGRITKLVDVPNIKSTQIFMIGQRDQCEFAAV